MKRFMVFVGDIHYPSGGMKDFKEDFSDIFEAIRYAQNIYYSDDYQWFHVYDLEKKEIIYEKHYLNGNYSNEKKQFLKSNLNLPEV